ncbi:phosphotransferase family protein [Rhabdothermincola salaria]|uniref:phosphotransferase family protein n=1 Tax=Rhabdothermincola salaria TaxID=2903142 RepID=UPI001E5E62A9|nr:phosphotransferase family protein [Rhabdothermincola salaria]MCD9622258.1 phosphotransferase family protein [Rhabdothermincola salaria]
MSPDDPTADRWGAATEQVRRWLETNLGEVRDLRRQPRWRPVWFADVERDGERLELVVRGDRTDMPLIFPLDHEMRLQQVLHDHGIPVPKVHGLIDEPLAYVMDRVGGQQDFRGTSDEDRRAVVDDYLQILARLHTLPLEPFRAAGIMGPERPEDAGTFGLARYEAVYRSTKNGPDPFMEFCLGWLHRNPPDSQGRQSAIVWDSGQFHQADGHIVALLDLEIGHLGDPMMDLAAWRMRDTIVGYGSFAELYARYEELTGAPVDLEALMRHHFAFTLTNQLALGQAVRAPHADTDLMTNMQWCLETNLFATEALAEILDVELPTVAVPEPRPSRATTALANMADVLRDLETDDEWLAYRLRTLFRSARHVRRVDEVGDALSDADLDDIHQVLGHRPDDWFAGEAELERFVLADAGTGRWDLELLALFHKRNLRAHTLLGPPGSAMATHLPIQTFR